MLLDDSLFTGPALNPAWSPEDVAAGEVAPLFPLALNSARFDPAKTTGPRPQDAAMSAAEAFSAELAAAAAAAGLTVAPGVARVPAGSQPDGGTAGTDGSGTGRVLAEVQSATVGQQVDLLLRTSDNYLTEAIGRMAAVAAGKPGEQRGRRRGRAAAARTNWKFPPAHCVPPTSPGWRSANQVSARQLSEVVRAITSGAGHPAARRRWPGSRSPGSPEPWGTATWTRPRPAARDWSGPRPAP